MTKQEGEKLWMEGRTRPVRVHLTEEEHAIVRAAAAIADLSVSRFSVEAVVAAARKLVPGESSPPPPKRPGRRRKGE